MTTNNQDWTLAKRKDELAAITTHISKMPISDEWKDSFTQICLYRGWVKIKTEHAEQMQNIADVDSPAVLYLSTLGKKVGLDMLERISAGTDEEPIRVTILGLIVMRGVKPSLKNIDLLLASTIRQPTLPGLIDEVGLVL